ncbi:esterase [Kitasatospora sp. NPDC052896]|uniref:esterase n=1 Tax=Kitasatospora sp. NPDC052896 TaxID=3364061 RepID=UPI0037C67626
MPPGARGALVQRVTIRPDGPLDVRWLPASSAPLGLGLGQILLIWEPASHSGMDVTARLGLATTEVLLATWPAAPDDWPHLVRPTLAEVTSLCAALKVATAAIEYANRLARS